MTPPTHDYSGYTLEQLHDLLRDLDQARFPERYTAIQRQIELRGGDSQLPRLQPFWTRRAQVTPALKAVRCIVGLQYGAVLGWLIYLFFDASKAGNESQMSGVIVAVLAIPSFCGLGVVTMQDSLAKVTNRAAVEIGWLSALGLAPVSAILYTVCAYWALSPTIGFFIFPLLLLVVPFGFYSPFVLFAMLIKYQYRSDEF